MKEKSLWQDDRSRDLISISAARRRAVRRKQKAKRQSLRTNSRGAGMVVNSDTLPRGWFSVRHNSYMKRAIRHGAGNSLCRVKRPIATGEGRCKKPSKNESSNVGRQRLNVLSGYGRASGNILKERWDAEISKAAAKWQCKVWKLRWGHTNGF